MALTGIKQNDIGIAADGDGALLRKAPKHFGGSRGRQLDKAVEVDAPGTNAAVVEQRESELNARRTVGNLGKVIPPDLFRLQQAVGVLVKAERAVVGCNNLQIVKPQPAPQRMLTGVIPQRRRPPQLAPESPHRSRHAG